MKAKSDIRLEELPSASYMLHKARIVELIQQLIGPEKVVDTELVQRSFRTASTRIMGAFHGDTLIGITMSTLKLHATGHELYVDDVVVDRAYRGRKVGSLLMEDLETFAKKRECTAVMFTSARDDAQKFYESLGYVSKTRAFKKSL